MLEVLGTYPLHLMVMALLLCASAFFSGSETALFFLSREHLRYRQESFIERIFVHKENPLKLEIRHFMDCAMNRSEGFVSEENELRSFKVSQQVLAILREDGVID